MVWKGDHLCATSEMIENPLAKGEGAGIIDSEVGVGEVAADAVGAVADGDAASAPVGDVPAFGLFG